MTITTAAEFLTAFQFRQAMCRALLDLSRRQSTLIAGDDYAQLHEVLKSKQGLIDHLGRMSQEQVSLYDAWPVQRDRLPATERERCDAVLAEIESLLTVLLSEEQASSNQLIVRRNVTQRELQSLAIGVETQRAYQSRPSPSLSRLDLNT
jgi:hypothetical protein